MVINIVNNKDVSVKLGTSKSTKEVLFDCKMLKLINTSNVFDMDSEFSLYSLNHTVCKMKNSISIDNEFFKNLLLSLGGYSDNYNVDRNEIVINTRFI